MSQRFFEGALHAAAYAKFRLTPPKNLGLVITNYLKEKVYIHSLNSFYTWNLFHTLLFQYQGPTSLAVDVGCGNGQSSSLLSSIFTKVLATDISPAQVEVAKKMSHPANIEFL